MSTEFSQLELKRFSSFTVRVEPTTIPNIHMFEATPKKFDDLCLDGSPPSHQKPASAAASSLSVPPSPRYFVRILLNYRMTNDDQGTAEQERHFVAALNALEIALKSNASTGTPGARQKTPSHHILMSVILQTTCSNGVGSGGGGASRAIGTSYQRLSPAAAELSTMALAKRYQQRLMINHVGVVEVRFFQRSLQGKGMGRDGVIVWVSCK